MTDPRVTRCVFCFEPIVWFDLDGNRQVCVEADLVEPDHTEFDDDKHIAHYTNCPEFNEDCL